MSWLSKVFSSTGINVISSVGKVLDDLVTTDEEVALSDIQKAKIKAAYNVRMQELLNQLDASAREHEQNMEEELTQRLKLDMKSDSWLSKNIRPMTLIFMTVAVALLAFLTVFNAQLSTVQLSTVENWIPFFQTTMLTIYGFYFGSRGLEKIQKIRSSGARPTTGQSSIPSLDQEPKG